MSSKCNMFLDPSGFSSEDIASPFNIPRTSSIAKSKRPSVSFAEGTRFSPKERRGSTQDPGALQRGKPKSPWGVLMLSALQGQAGGARTGEEEAADNEESEDAADVQADHEKSECEAANQDEDKTPPPGLSGRKRTTSNSVAHKGTPTSMSAPDAPAASSNRVTTVYVTVGKAGKPVTTAEPSSEGPVQAMLRRLGSLQRQREHDPCRPKPKAAEGIAKPPRRKLGARASVWEQGGPSGAEVGVGKPVRRKPACHNPPDADSPGEAPPSENSTPKRPLSSILKSVPELSPNAPGQSAGGDGRQAGGPGAAETESDYLTVGPAGDAASLTEIITNEGATDEPCYENILIKHS